MQLGNDCRNFEDAAAEYAHDFRGFELDPDEIRSLGSVLDEKLLPCCELNRKTIQTLQNKLTVLIQEKQSAVSLWRTSQKTVQALEIELSAYQTDYSEKPQNNTFFTQNIESKFSAALEQINKLEFNINQHKITKQKLENDLKSKCDKISLLNEKLKTSDELRNDLILVKAEISELKNEKIKMAEVVEGGRREMEMIMCREKEARIKVAEALKLLDKALADKDIIAQEHNMCSQQIEKLTKQLESVKDETEKQFQADLDKYKESFNEKIGDMLNHIHVLDVRLEQKSILAEKLNRELNIIKKAHRISEKQSCEKIDPILESAEKRLEAAFQELLLSERRNIQLSTEKQCLVLDIQTIKDRHERELKRRDWEEQMHKLQLQEFKNRINHLKKCLKETHQMVDKLQKMIANKNISNVNIRREDTIHFVEDNNDEKEKDAADFSPTISDKTKQTSHP